MDMLAMKLALARKIPKIWIIQQTSCNILLCSRKTGCALLLYYVVKQTVMLRDASVMQLVKAVFCIFRCEHYISDGQFDIVIFMVMDAGALLFRGCNEHIRSLSGWSLSHSLISWSPLLRFSGLQFNLCVFCLREGNRPALQRSVIYIDLPFGWRDGWRKRERW